MDGANQNGVIELTIEQFEIIKEKLLEIQSRPQLEDGYGGVLSWDTFWTTATYNRENPDVTINGDTCEWILSQP